MIRLLFGALIVFLAVASFGGIFITFFRFNDFILSGVTLLVSLIAMEISEHNKGLFSVSMMREIIFNVLRSFRAIARELVNAPIPSVRTLILIAIILLFGLGFYTLFSLSYAEIYIKTPWDVIPDQFVLVIALLSLWLLYKIFTKPAFFLLVPIILFSLLQHLYIPAVYRLPYGGDTWRHTASMMEIEDNGFLSSSSYDTLKIGSFIMPSSVFTTSSYASFWAGGIFLNRALNVGLISIMVWWQYLIFSLALPILFFLLFDCICDKNRSVSLLGAFLPSLFFPMQAYGAVSLPVGFGFLVFMIFLLATVFWLKKREKKYFIALCIVLILLAIQYVVYVLFGALILGFLIVQKRTSRVLRIAYLIVSSALVPIISLFVSPNARLDILTTGASHILDFWKHTLLYLFGLKGMDGYYLHTGNLLWHSMRDRLTDLPLFSWNYLDTLLFFCFVAAISASIFWMCRRRAINNNPVSALFLYILFIGLMSIFLDRSYLGGIHLLTERLDLIIDTAFIFFLIGGFIAVRDGVRLIEYNVRFGDPEAMNVLPILKTDFVDICLAMINGTLADLNVEFEKKATVCKYLVPEGYPDNPCKDKKVEVGVIPPQVKTYYASVDQREDGLYLSGSRAIAFVGIADSLDEASAIATSALGMVEGPVFYRKDIGTKELIDKRLKMMKELRG
ncbi:MAG TPA: hypothetical protein DEP11_02720 [Candidatus Jacksonbacteria bacterium]|nr:hypothetical protein [Candidatus Jacksonbacteria bacterium]